MSSLKNIEEKVYRNSGNCDLIKLVDQGTSNILDVGIGNGSNANALRSKLKKSVIHGITVSKDEAELAGEIYDRVWLFDIAQELPDEFKKNKYDTIIFSHILEHLPYPDQIILKFKDLLTPKGKFIIAVPNIVHYSIRLKVLFGNFNYVETGILDYTHLRFFTYSNAESILFKGDKNIKVAKYASGKMPMFFLRRLLPEQSLDHIDHLFTRLFPNLLSWQVLLVGQYGNE